MLKWFWITMRKTRNLHYLVAGENVTDALKRIAVPYQDVSVSEATWRSIAMQIGCAIPNHAAPNDQAVGFIPFATRTASIAIWPG